MRRPSRSLLCVLNLVREAVVEVVGFEDSRAEGTSVGGREREA